MQCKRRDVDNACQTKMINSFKYAALQQQICYTLRFITMSRSS